jgi:hypothetical protein
MVSRSDNGSVSLSGVTVRQEACTTPKSLRYRDCVLSAEAIGPYQKNGWRPRIWARLAIREALLGLCVDDVPWLGQASQLDRVDGTRGDCGVLLTVKVQEPGTTVLSPPVPAGAQAEARNVPGNSTVARPFPSPLVAMVIISQNGPPAPEGAVTPTRTAYELGAKLPYAAGI